MAAIYGTVKKQDVKPITSKKTGKSFNIHTAEVEDSNGTVHTVEFGFNKPKLHEGAFYKMECEKEYGQLKVKNFEEADAADAPAPAAPAPQQKYANDKGFLVKMFPVPVDHPDRSIIRQNALTQANNLFSGVTSTSELITFYEQDNGKQPASVDELLAWCKDKVLDLAYEFEAYSTGDLEERAMREMTDKSKAE